ncbi:MAG: MFS transporter [Nocardioidaceae bacterium]|nr:MFS transporter [Nocardioidaceae bacterium]
MSTTTTAPPPVSTAEPEMSHRQILEVLVGLLAALFTGILSSTIVSNALPTIISDLEGSQTQYTWVITASLLAMTVSTPIWAKMSDLFNKKTLVQTAIVVFVVGSVVAGFSRSVPELLGARVVQGLGMGGLTALAQSIIGSVIPPRVRGRYSGYMGAVMALATVSGPLIGGVIVDTPALGWRWCFFVCIPLAVISLGVLQKFLHVETIKRKVRIDWMGAVLISIGASLPLLWVSFAGNDFAWMSWQTAAFLGGTVVAVGLAIVVESKHPEPLVPLTVVKDRTTALAIIASVAVGIAMFGGSVFLGQYFQIARGYSPTQAGLLTIPLMIGSLVGTVTAGQIITRTGKWKRFLVGGSILLVAGLGMLGTIDHTTAIWHLSIFMVAMGIGMGMLMQNLVLAVQNTVDVTQVGAASGAVAFFRSLGGAVGVSVLGAVLASRVSDKMATGLSDLGISSAQADAGGGAGSLDLSAMPAPIRELTRTAYGDATGRIFLIAAVVALVSLVAVLLIREVPLRTTVRKLDDDGAGGEPVLDASGDQPADDDTTTDVETVDVTARPAHRSEADVDAAEQQERQAVAAVDVLTRAEQSAMLRAEAAQEAVHDAVEAVGRLRAQASALFDRVDAELRELERQVPERTAPRHAADPAAVLDGQRDHGELTDDLRRYELAVLQESQRVADGVVSHARDEEASLQARIAELRQVEAHLLARVQGSLASQEASDRT